MIKKFIHSKNKIHFLVQHKGELSTFFAVLTVALGVYGYYGVFEGEKYSFYTKVFCSFSKAVQLFGLSFPEAQQQNIYTILASFTAIVTIMLTAMLFFFKKQVDRQIFKKISKNEHIGVFGLGDITKAFLDDDIDMGVVIVEKDETSVDDYRARGFGVKVGDAFNEQLLQKDLKFDNMKYALIAFGDDKTNIEFAKKVIDIYKNKTPIKLIIHINDKDLTRLFHKSLMIKNDQNLKINVKTFSYYEECARDLFDKHYIDGDSMKYVNSSETFETVLLGDNELIKRVVYKIISLSHLPNQNKHIIYIVNKKASTLLEHIKNYINYDEDNGTAKFPTIELKAIDIDYDKQDFYLNNIWKRANIENIICCYDDESINIKLGIMLHDKIYLSDTVNDKKVPKIIIGVFSELMLSRFINDDKEDFKNIFTFGNKRDIITVKHLYNETVDEIAKLIHSGYGDEYQPDVLKNNREEIEKKWFETTRFSDKISNIAQARHINIKLKSLGLKMLKCTLNCTAEELRDRNRSLLNKALEGKRDFDDETFTKYSLELKKVWNKEDYKVYYWPADFDSNLFNKLVRAEHNRWNAHHYLEGWKYSKEKNKKAKEHDCLLPLEKFDKDNIKITVIYDAYSILYLPNYLANTGYVIEWL
ncbi:NAD-binding protein [Sulfurimonas sp. ST-27]|uniref:NAD-binding protein n=1 Tax=Sulfurimonas sp. ST-27 TaxID=3400152 RepID=UPI003AB6C1BD